SQTEWFVPASLFPSCFHRHVHFHILPAALDNYRPDVARLFRAQCVREIIKVLYRLAVKFDEQVTLFQTRFCGRTIILDIGEKNTRKVVAEIRYRAEVRAIT